LLETAASVLAGLVVGYVGERTCFGLRPEVLSQSL